MSANPFKPTAGKMPPILIGRQPIIDDFTEALENGAGAPGRLMLITGQRGYGKTVMLTELRRVATANGWLAIADTASEGLCERLVEALDPQALKLETASISPSLEIAGLASAKLGGVSLSAKGSGPLTLRNAIEKRLGGRGVKKGKGILFTIDEAQAAARDELVAIATALQHVIADEDQKDIPDEEKKGVAFVFAGLPSMVDELVNDKILTFLRRSLRRDLGEVSQPDIKNAFIETVHGSGFEIDEPIARRAACLTDGYPYMVQLVGYYMWQSARRAGHANITEADVESGYQDALLAFGDAVCAPALDGLPASARNLARAMAQDETGPTRVADLAERTGKSRAWVNKYRSVLIREQVARAAGHGELDFAIPHMREYIRGSEQEE